MQVSVLMTLPEFRSANEELIRGSVGELEDEDWLVSVDLDQPVSFVYRDPKQRFELKYPSVGSPANYTTVMLTRSTRLGTEVLAVKQVEIVLSDGAPLKQRAIEAEKLRSYLDGAGFTSVSFDGFELTAGRRKVTTLSGIAEQADLIDLSVLGRGVTVFTLEKEELLLGVSIIPQLFTSRDDDYTLHLFLAEKEEGIDY
jgi:hypothetical protein